jgi:N-acetylmuramoyl-L-alanine amidase
MLAAACAPAGPRAPTPAPPAAAPARLPPVPERTGPLYLDVVYPPNGATLGARDSTFIFGSTGTGRASVLVNGDSVAVAANGAFLGFLPIPRDGVYHVVALAGAQTQRTDVRVKLPEQPGPPPAGQATIADGSIYPTGAWAVPAGTAVEVGFQGTPGGEAALLLPDGSVVPMLEQTATESLTEGVRNFGIQPARLNAAERPLAWSRYGAAFAAMELSAGDARVPSPELANGQAPSQDIAGTARVRLVVQGDTAVRPLRLNLAVLQPGEARVALAVPPSPGADAPDQVRASPGPDGTWSYFWPPATRLEITAQHNDQYRVALGAGLGAWIDRSLVQLLPPGAMPPRARVGTVRLHGDSDAVDIRFSMTARVPFDVRQGDGFIEVTLYDATADTGWLQYGATDPFVRRAEWSQPLDGVYRLRLDLAGWPWGYRATWEPGGDLVVRVRKPPRIDPAAPLRGLTIAVDPGHPPGGAISPYRITEAQVNLGIARHLQALLQAAGGRVVMTRNDSLPVGLYARTALADSQNADLLVSIHNNAFPDGVDPYTNSGTSAYYFHAPSAELARDLDQELVAELGLRDLGIGRSSLALVRNPTWMPAVLTETMFMMIPQQGAALSNPAVQQRIAEAHLRGIERFLRERGRH